MTLIISILILIVIVCFIITDIVISAKNDSAIAEMIAFVHCPMLIMALILLFNTGGIIDPTLVVFIILCAIVTLVHALIKLKSYLNDKYLDGKINDATTIYESKEIDICTEPKYVDDKVSCFKAYKIKMHKHYKKEDWDEYVINCIFSSKDIIDELFKHDLKIEQYRSDPTFVMNDKNVEFIKNYFKFNESYDGDIDLNNLRCTVWKIDNRDIYVIGGPNKNLELCDNANMQFLCYAFKYLGDNFIMTDYSIDNLMRRINNYFGH